MTCYRIRNWNNLFETAETRKLKRLTWVPIPNKHDGKGYRRLLRLQDGPLLYAAWLLLVQVASKCPIRGLLADDDGPLNAVDLSDKTDYPADYFEKAFKALVRPEIGWLEDTADGGQMTDECQASDGQTIDPCHFPNESPGVTGESPGVTADAPGTPVLKGREGTGREGTEKTTLARNSTFNGVQLELVYRSYPRKIAPAKACEAIHKALKRIAQGKDKPDGTEFWPPDDPVEWLTMRARLFASSPSGQAGKFTPHPTTWFNQARYADDEQEWQRGGDSDRRDSRQGAEDPARTRVRDYAALDRKRKEAAIAKAREAAAES